ncbi:MAG: HAD family hydrolase [Myxococcota bacterium]
MSRLIILDFDGTMTNAEAEGVPFRTGYLEDLAVLCGISSEQVQALAARYEAEVAQAPQEYGWMFEGRIVAPAVVDPYLRIMPVARKIFDHLGVFSAERDRSRLLDGILYKYNYQKTVIAFREGAREFLTWLGAQAQLEGYVVTNSHTEPVSRKIQQLGQEPDGSNTLAWMQARVYGRARKYMIDDAFTAVPEHMNVPGLSRPVLLRRRFYAETLEQLRTHHGVAWADVTVVGDIFELDLALPLSLGAQVILVGNTHTPAYERAFVQRHPRARLAEHLADVQALLTQPERSPEEVS